MMRFSRRLGKEKWKPPQRTVSHYFDRPYYIEALRHLDREA